MALPAPFLSDPSIPSWDVARTARLRSTQPEQHARAPPPLPTWRGEGGMLRLRRAPMSARAAAGCAWALTPRWRHAPG